MRLRVATWISMAVLLLSSVSAQAKDSLYSGERLNSNEYLQSANGQYRFNLQGDGNLVLRNAAGKSLWSSATHGKGGVRLSLQSDGNLVLYTSRGKSVWSTKTNGKGVNRAVMQNDGNFVLYTASNTSAWSTGTAQPVADTTKPVITLTGSATVSLTQGATFTDPGATATDNVDGNITSKIVKTGSVNTGTVGIYTLRYDVRDAAGNAANTVTRTVNVTAPAPILTPTPTPTPSPGNGDNDGSASSTGQFSAPSAALYTLNNAKQRVFPRHIDTGFGGNGHAETWDGRVFVRTRTAGWFASAFRPQRITLNGDGSPNFTNGAFGNSVALELDADVTDMQHNWIAIVPDPAVTGENPYPSNASGTFS
ncbi:MAG: DUF5011 domain-containing protein, partial [Gammaproteobacteria bacterium]|nr:DUF5011 domain-containing protein [Gammaproteobacteria bacterium]